MTKFVRIFVQFKGVIIVLFCISSTISFAQETSGEIGYGKAKKAIKHNLKVPRLTYFVHNGDSLKQLFNVSVSREENHIILKGWITETNYDILKVYEKLKVDRKGKKLSAEEKLLSNQVHISVKNIESDAGSVTVMLDAAIEYTLIETTKSSRNYEWILPVIGGVGLVGLVGLIIKGISIIV